MFVGDVQNVELSVSTRLFNFLCFGFRFYEIGLWDMLVDYDGLQVGIEWLTAVLYAIGLSEMGLGFGSKGGCEFLSLLNDFMT